MRQNKKQTKLTTVTRHSLHGLPDLQHLRMMQMQSPHPQQHPKTYFNPYDGYIYIEREEDYVVGGGAGSVRGRTRNRASWHRNAQQQVTIAIIPYRY